MFDDPEIAAMGVIKQALDALDEGARDRVLRWARDRYSPAKQATSAAQMREPGPAWQPSAMRNDTTREQRRVTFTDAAAVYDAANPSSDGDKLLAVGYWFQVVQGESELDSQSINSELKNLGYPITNVSRAVTNLGRTTPKLVVQTKKTGSTKQARKKFRLTVEGIRRVEQMIGGSAAPAPARDGEHDDSDPTDD